MPDTVTTTTSQSWFSRMKNSAGGVLFGIIIFLLSFVVLWTNEGRSVKTYKGLKEGAKNVFSLSDARCDPANEGKLIHMSGNAVSGDTLTDPVTGLSVTGISLARHVKMYQWKETAESKTKEKIGGGTETTTTYTYTKAWDSSYHATSGFNSPEGHLNPAKDIDSGEFTANSVIAGEFNLNKAQISMIGGSVSHPFTGADFNRLPVSVRTRSFLQDGTLYIGRMRVANPSDPQVGDYQISFSMIPSPQAISLVAKQAGRTFEPYVSKSGYTFQLLQNGTISAENMFVNAQNSNRILTWLLRLLGVVMMGMGLSLMTKPLSTLGSVIPLLGKIVGAGLGIVTFLITAALSLTTIAIAWIVYRPVLGITLLCLAGASIFLGVKLKAQKR